MKDYTDFMLGRLDVETVGRSAIPVALHSTNKQHRYPVESGEIIERGRLVSFISPEKSQTSLQHRRTQGAKKKVNGNGIALHIIDGCIHPGNQEKASQLVQGDRPTKNRPTYLRHAHAPVHQRHEVGQLVGDLVQHRRRRDRPPNGRAAGQESRPDRDAVGEVVYLQRSKGNHGERCEQLVDVCL